MHPVITVAFAFVAFLAGAALTGASTQSVYQTEAVEHGCAAYDPQTGEWGWKQ